MDCGDTKLDRTRKKIISGTMVMDVPWVRRKGRLSQRLMDSPKDNFTVNKEANSGVDLKQNFW